MAVVIAGVRPMTDAVGFLLMPVHDLSNRSWINFYNDCLCGEIAHT